MSNIKFDSPKSIEQVEAIGGLYKALYIVAQAHGSKDPGKFIESQKWHMEYSLDSHLAEQANEAEKDRIAAEEAKAGEGEIAVPESTGGD